MKENIDDALSYSIIGCAMRVHNKMGNGFQEVIYQRALEVEFGKAGIIFSREEDIPVYYYDHYVGTRRVDFIFPNELILEIKATSKLDDRHLAQGLNYLVTYKLEKGLLINFGSPKLEIKRLRLPKNIQAHNYTKRLNTFICFYPNFYLSLSKFKTPLLTIRYLPKLKGYLTAKPSSIIPSSVRNPPYPNPFSYINVKSPSCYAPAGIYSL